MAEYTASIRAAFQAVGTTLKNKVSRGEGWVDLRKQPNVVGNGTTDDSVAIQSALDSALSLGLRVYAYGSFGISSTINIKGAVDMSQATFTWRGSGPASPAINVGGTTARVQKIAGDIFLPKLNNPKSGTGWLQANTLGSVGVRIQRLETSNVHVQDITQFETGLLLYGNTDGVSYCHVFLGALENNKVNFKMDTDGVGWVNQNWFYGGRFSHYSNEGTTPQPGVMHIYSTRTIGVNGAPNTNTFIGPSIESPNTVEWCINMDRGSFNCFYNPRFEITNGNGTVRWGDEARYNEIDHGYNTSEVVETHISGSIGNAINGAKFRRRFTQTTKGEVLENTGSSTNPVITIMRAGGVVAGDDPVTAYAAKLTSQGYFQKAYTDGFDRYSLVNGAVRFGAGTAAPAVGFGGNTSGVLTTGHLYAATDNTYDIGALASFRWRSLFLSGGIARGFRTITAATTAGANDSTIVSTATTAVTLTLPSAVTQVGREFMVRNNGTATLTVAATAGTVDKTSVAVGESVIYQSNATNWLAIITSGGGSTTDATDYLAAYNTAKG